MPLHPPPSWPKWLAKLFNETAYLACRGLNDEQFDIRQDDTKKLGIASLLTEFGAIPFDKEGYEIVDLYIKKMESLLQGWIYWGITENNCSSEVLCTVGEELAKSDEGLRGILTRVKVQTVAGITEKINFDPAGNNFTLLYRTSMDEKVFSQATEIFANPEIHYPNGYDLYVVPTRGVNVTFDSDSNLFKVVAEKSEYGRIKRIFVNIRGRDAVDRE